MHGPDFATTLTRHAIEPLQRQRTRVLQVNVGFKCDLACHHCHVEAGPARTEALSPAAADRILELLAAYPQLETLDLTGGAPELSSEFRRLVTGARALRREVIDRCNLTVLHEPGQEDTAEFLAAHGVHIVASLPCYTPENVEAQRGRERHEWDYRPAHHSPASLRNASMAFCDFSRFTRCAQFTPPNSPPA